MANALYGNVYYVDTAGIISKTPLDIRAILHYPNAVSDALDLNWWDEANPIANSNVALTATAASGTLTDDDSDHNVLTSAAFPATSVIKVTYSNGLAANRTYHLVGTAGNDDRIIIDPTAGFSDEANVAYTLIAYPARAAFNCLQSTATNTHESKYHYFGHWRVPNLICEGITATSYALIYIN